MKFIQQIDERLTLVQSFALAGAIIVSAVVAHIIFGW